MIDFQSFFVSDVWFEIPWEIISTNVVTRLQSEITIDNIEWVLDVHVFKPGYSLLFFMLHLLLPLYFWCCYYCYMLLMLLYQTTLIQLYTTAGGLKFPNFSFLCVSILFVFISISVFPVFNIINSSSNSLISYH